MIEPRSGACERTFDVVDTTAPAQPVSEPPHRRYHMLPQGWTDWIAVVLILGVVAICFFGLGAATRTPIINDKLQQIDKLQKDNSGLRTTLQQEGDKNASLTATLAETEKRLNEAFNAYRSIDLNANATTSVSTGGFTVRLGGPPANGRVSINVNGTQHQVTAGDSVEAGISNCKVHVNSIDGSKLSLLTSCPIDLNANDTPSVSVGSFTVGLVGPPANNKVSINVNGTQHTVAAGESIDAGISNCRVQVKSFDSFRVTLLTSCPPPPPPPPPSAPSQPKP
jgi:hypothetical protein